MLFDGFQIYTGPCNKCPGDIEPWITQFCSKSQNSWFVQIEEDWAGDWFNQYGISSHFDDFDAAIELITDKHGKDWNNFTDEKIQSIHQQALNIYGRLHARWICQPRGMALMKEKYDSGIFGRCPRVSCNGVKTLPMGPTFTVHRHTAKLYCPKCNDIYRPPPPIMYDGAFFGPSFPHMFLSEYTDVDKTSEFKPFVMRAFGLKVHRSSKDRISVHDRNDYEEEYPQESA